MLWKNGIAQELTNGSNTAVATSLWVSGSDVFVGGYETIAFVDNAKYWINGRETILSSSTPARVNSISVK